MSTPINLLKRHFNETSLPPKRLKINPGEIILNDLDRMSRILSITTLAAIGNFACVNKQAYLAAQLAFLEKARKIGYSVQDSSQAKFQIQKIYLYVRTVLEFHRFWNKPFNSIEEAVLAKTNQSLSEIFAELSQLKMYKNPDHPLLDLLQIKSSWKNAKVNGRELTYTEQIKGHTALRYAAQYNRPQLVKYIQKHHINPNQSERFLARPLHGTIPLGNIENVKVLNHQGKEIFDKTSLISRIVAHMKIAALGNFACANKRAHQLAQVAFLEKARAIGYSFDDSAQAKLQIQKIYQYVRTVFEFQQNFFESIEDAVFAYTNGDLSHILEHLTQLQWYKNPDHPILELWENESSWKNAKVDGRELTDKEQIDGHTALRYAAYFKRPRLVKLLLEHQIDPNQTIKISPPTLPDTSFPIALKSAILAGDLESVNHLLNPAAILNGSFQEYWERLNHSRSPTLLQCALGSSDTRRLHPNAELNMTMIKFLLAHGATITPNAMIDAAETCSMDAVQLLMANGGEFNEEMATESFFRVVEVNVNFSFDTHHDEMLTFLLSQGANINALDEKIPLHTACKNRSLPWAQYLVSHGADTTLIDFDERTPLMHATLAGSLEVVKFLLENGASANQRVQCETCSSHDETLAYTCFTEKDEEPFYTPDSNSPELVKLLLSYGAEPIRESNSKTSPLYLARKHGLTEIAQIMEDHITSSMLNL